MPYNIIFLTFIIYSCGNDIENILSEYVGTCLDFQFISYIKICFINKLLVGINTFTTWLSGEKKGINSEVLQHDLQFTASVWKIS